MTNINLAIIIVTYNSEKVIGQCLNSLHYLNTKFTVFISDNGSSDSTASISDSLGCKVLLNNKNLGYSKAINKAFEHFVDPTFTHVLILNPDVFFTDVVNPSLLLENCSDKDVISIKMKNSNGDTRISTYKFPSVFNLYLNRQRLDHTMGKSRRIVDTVEGSFMLMKRDLFKLVEGFDENIFLYGEDYEFCYRVKKLGGNILYNPENYYVHDGGFNPSRKPLVLGGLIYFFKKHHSFITYCYAHMVIKIKARLTS